jgi:hypothetical protein
MSNVTHLADHQRKLERRVDEAYETVSTLVRTLPLSHPARSAWGLIYYRRAANKCRQNTR